MVRHVLVPIDGSTKSKKALDFTLEEYPGADITALYVIDPVESVPEMASTSGSLSEAQQEHADAILQEAADIAAEFDGKIETESRGGKPATEILTHTEEAGIDHIVMGSHGRSGLSRVLMGSVTESVARRAPVPVTVVR